MYGTAPSCLLWHAIHSVQRHLFHWQQVSRRIEAGVLSKTAHMGWQRPIFWTIKHGYCVNRADSHRWLVLAPPLPKHTTSQIATPRMCEQKIWTEWSAHILFQRWCSASQNSQVLDGGVFSMQPCTLTKSHGQKIQLIAAVEIDVVAITRVLCSWDRCLVLPRSS